MHRKLSRYRVSEALRRSVLSKGDIFVFLTTVLAPVVIGLLTSRASLTSRLRTVERQRDSYDRLHTTETAENLYLRQQLERVMRIAEDNERIAHELRTAYARKREPIAPAFAVSMQPRVVNSPTPVNRLARIKKVGDD